MRAKPHGRSIDEIVTRAVRDHFDTLYHRSVKDLYERDAEPDFEDDFNARDLDTFGWYYREEWQGEMS